MLEIKVYHIHEWRTGHADPLARIERILNMADDVLARISTSVDNIIAAVGIVGEKVGDVATAIRNHPAATTDSGALAALADKLDSAAHSLTDVATTLTTLTAEENAGAPAGGGTSTGGDGSGGAPAGGDGGSGTVVQPPADLAASPNAISGTAGQPITGSISVSGGTAPYTFSSSLPEVVVDASGNLSGTPSVAGDGVIIVGDSATPPASTSVALSIAAAPTV